ncbi:MAG: hypothetical protein WCJ51_05090 [Candidatus Moraniibacteriota bacterium]
MKNQQLREFIEKIKTGSKEEIKLANKMLEKIWYDFDKESAERKEMLEMFISEFGNFEAIKTESNKIAFIGSLKYAFMSAGQDDSNFEACARFVLYCMANPSGHIRQAMIHVSTYLVHSLRLSFSDFRKNEQDEKLILKNQESFGKFITEFDAMTEHFYERKYKRFKYISSLPPSVYKSLEILRSQLLCSEYYQKMYAEYKNKRLRTVLPQLVLKYTQLGVDTIEAGFVCSICQRRRKRLGSSNPLAKKPKMICEDCTIDEYMKDYGYKTRAAAAARRRRIFDVGYLWQDLLVDRYLAENNKKHIRELGAQETAQLFRLGVDMYNNLFDKGDKIFLEEIFDQKEIEKRLLATLSYGDFDWDFFRANLE